MLILGDAALVEREGSLINVLNALDVPAGPLILPKERDANAARLFVERNGSAQKRQEVGKSRLSDADLKVQHDTAGTFHLGESRSIADNKVASLTVWDMALLPIELTDLKGV